MSHLNDAAKAAAKAYDLPHGFLSEVDRQRQYVRQRHLIARSCPSCNQRQTAYEAVEGDPSLDQYELGGGHTYRCIRCLRPLTQILPLISTAPWYWAIDFARETEGNRAAMRDAQA